MTASEIQVRPFRNSDSPRIAEVWCAQPAERGLAQPMSATLFEEHVVAKPYFDRNGLLVAYDGDHVVGFIHASFGPAEDHQQLATDPGVILMLLVRPHDSEHQIAAALIDSAEAYLHKKGARQLIAGGAPPLDAFYTGLYGGTELSGVLASDERATTFFGEAGYVPVRTTDIYQRTLVGFRAPMDRQQMQLRRSTSFDFDLYPKPRDWWDAWTKITCERTRHALRKKTSGETLATVMAWAIEPLASTWGVHAVGLFGLEVKEEGIEQGYARFLLCEVLRSLEAEGCTLAEVNVAEGDEELASIVADLGFRAIDRGIVMSKTAQ